VLLVEDPDADGPEPLLHWMAYGIDPAATGLPENVPSPGHPGGPARMRQGLNARGTHGWAPPCPPRAGGIHHYHFELFALDSRLHVPDEVTLSELLRAMEGHVIASGELVGTYDR
jgi:Raf kinase inhibitor-like YbhB/YbcL family protein